MTGGSIVATCMSMRTLWLQRALYRLMQVNRRTKENREHMARDCKICRAESEDAGAVGVLADRYSSFFGSFDMRSRRSCMSFICRRRSSILSSGAGSGAFSGSLDSLRGGANGLNIEKVC